MTSAVVGFSAAGPFGHQWLPVAGSAGIQDAPAAVRLMGRNLVLWRSPSGRVVAAPELCTHSKGELTKGEVNDGLLVCPKHGWTFGDEGRCVFKPSKLPINDRAHLKIHPCAERYGLVWVSMNEPATEVMDLSWEDDGSYRRIYTDVSMWRCNAIKIIESLLAQDDSLFVDTTADLPFVVQGAFKSEETEHRYMVACAPADSRTSLVTTVLWTSNSTAGDDAKIVDEALAALSAVKSAAENEPTPTPTVEIAGDEEGTAAADWKRRLLAFAGPGAA